MSAVVLIRDDTLSELVLDGCLSIERRRDGMLTRHAVPDRTYVVDGLTILPNAISIEALISQSPSIEGLATGPERISQVIEWLTEARRVAAIVSLQEPGRAQDTNLVVERFSDVSGASDAPTLSIALGEVRIAETSSVTLSGRQTTTPPVPSDRARDGEAERDLGKRSSFLVEGGDAFVANARRFFGVAP